MYIRVSVSMCVFDVSLYMDYQERCWRRHKSFASENELRAREAAHGKNASWGQKLGSINLWPSTRWKPARRRLCFPLSRRDVAARVTDPETEAIPSICPSVWLPLSLSSFLIKLYLFVVRLFVRLLVCLFTLLFVSLFVLVSHFCICSLFICLITLLFLCLAYCLFAYLLSVCILLT